MGLRVSSPLLRFAAYTRGDVERQQRALQGDGLHGKPDEFLRLRTGL